MTKILFKTGTRGYGGVERIQGEFINHLNKKNDVLTVFDCEVDSNKVMSCQIESNFKYLASKEQNQQF